MLAGSRPARTGSVRIQEEAGTAQVRPPSSRGGDANGACHGDGAATAAEMAPRSPAASWSAGAGRGSRHASVGSPSEAHAAAGSLPWAAMPRQATPPPPLRRIGSTARATSQAVHAQMRGSLSPSASAASSAAAAEARLGPSLLRAVRSALRAAPVTVHIRCRPEVEGDRALAEAAASRGSAWGGLWADSERATVSVTPGPASPGLRAVHFGFDAVIPAEATQEEVFKAGACGLVHSAVAGRSTAVFAYGPSGTGKTYTLLGDMAGTQRMGLIPRSIAEAFARLRESGVRASDSLVTLSVLEVYNERLTDLLWEAGPGAGRGASRPALRIAEGANGSAVCLGLSQAVLEGPSDAKPLLIKAARASQRAATALNRDSNRSHRLFFLRVATRRPAGHGQAQAGGSGARPRTPSRSPSPAPSSPLATARSPVWAAAGRAHTPEPADLATSPPPWICGSASQTSRSGGARGGGWTAGHSDAGRSTGGPTLDTGAPWDSEGSMVLVDLAGSESACREGGSGAGALSPPAFAGRPVGGDGSLSRTPTGRSGSPSRLSSPKGPTGTALATGGAARVGSDTGNINRSLLTLSRVISALASKEGRVPYRDSKLTRLCADALGGRCSTMMIGTLAPSRGMGDDSRTALEFLARAREALNLSQTPLEERLARAFLQAREQLAEAKGEVYRLESAAANAAEEAESRLAEARLSAEQEVARLQAMWSQRLEEQQQEAEAALADTEERLEAKAGEALRQGLDAAEEARVEGRRAAGAARSQGEAGVNRARVEAAAQLEDARARHAAEVRSMEDAWGRRLADAETRASDSLRAERQSSMSALQAQKEALERMGQLMAQACAAAEAAAAAAIDGMDRHGDNARRHAAEAAEAAEAAAAEAAAALAGTCERGRAVESAAAAFEEEERARERRSAAEDAATAKMLSAAAAERVASAEDATRAARARLLAALTAAVDDALGVGTLAVSDVAGAAQRAADDLATRAAKRSAAAGEPAAALSLSVAQWADGERKAATAASAVARDAAARTGAASEGVRAALGGADNAAGAAARVVRERVSGSLQTEVLPALSRAASACSEAVGARATLMGLSAPAAPSGGSPGAASGSDGGVDRRIPSNSRGGLAVGSLVFSGQAQSTAAASSLSSSAAVHGGVIGGSSSTASCSPLATMSVGSAPGRRGSRSQDPVVAASASGPEGGSGANAYHTHFAPSPLSPLFLGSASPSTAADRTASHRALGGHDLEASFIQAVVSPSRPP